MKIQLRLISILTYFNYYLSNVLYGFYGAVQRNLSAKCVQPLLLNKACCD